jgi:uncharacterized protein (TIGR02145 family)
MLGGGSVAGKTMKLITGYTDWDANTYNDGNTSGFSALPAGSRGHSGGFGERGFNAYFWEASEYFGSVAYFRYLYKGYPDLLAFYYDKSYGFSVRCFKDF